MSKSVFHPILLSIFLSTFPFISLLPLPIGEGEEGRGTPSLSGRGSGGEAPDTLPPYEVTRAMPLFYEQLREGLTYPLAWRRASPGTPFSRWRDAARDRLRECLQKVSPAPGSFDPAVLATERREGYEARKIRFNLSAWSRVNAYLLVPDGEGPFPAVLMLHDHGAHFTIGKEKMVRPFQVPDSLLADADDWAVRCYDGQYPGDYFAAHGYVVLSVDALLWGERGRREGPDYDAQQALASNLLQMGTSWGALIAWDDERSARFLASLPCVDPNRVGSLGFSMGAYRSWMLAALTDCVSASASVCWMNTTRHLMTLTNNQNKGGSAYAMLVPGLRRYLDYPDVAAIACPKPALFFNGTRDKLFPVEGVLDAYDILREAWHSQQVDDRLVTRLWDEKHFFNRDMQQQTLEFFDKWLK